MQGSLFGFAEPALDDTFAGIRRIELPGGAWVEVLPNWLGGADVVFQELADGLLWRQHTVPMYERYVDEPRLTSWWSSAEGNPEPLPVLGSVRRALTDRYSRAFDSIGFNLYRDGFDSVAWHGDRLHDRLDAVIAIVSVGEPRQLRLRPKPGCAESAGGSPRSFALGEGTLLVMGGTCQATWQHGVPKSSKRCGPRMSVTFRHTTT
jgi:alkylated DNA repair dioxygenase AlkB